MYSKRKEVKAGQVVADLDQGDLDLRIKLQKPLSA